MDARIHQIGTTLAVLSLVTGVVIGGRDYLASAKKPTQTALAPVIPKSGEFTPITLKDGSSWALVKVWKPSIEGQPGGLELFNPTIPPSPDLIIVKDGISRGITGFVMELVNAEGRPTWGWAFVLKQDRCIGLPQGSCTRDLSDFEYVPITQEFVNLNKDLFDALNPNSIRKK